MKILLKIIYFFGFVLELHSNLNAQNSITWQRTYGDNNIDYGFSIVQTPDEGYVAVGRKRIETGNYVFAMRINKYGDTVWTKTYPGFKANQIEKTSDGNFIIAATGNLIKIDINGDTIWTHPESSGAKLKETSDKGFIICLSENNGSFLFYPKLKKVDSSGNIQWERIYTHNIYDGRFSDITIDKDGNYIVTGNFSDTAYIWDYLFIMKTDHFGNVIWFKKYESILYSTSIIFLKNDFYVVGGTDSRNGNRAFLSKLNSIGERIWFKTFDPGNPVFGDCNSIINTIDGGLAFTGTYQNGDFDYFIRLIKTDIDGNEMWRKLYGFGDVDVGYNIRQTKDRGYIIIGIRDNFQFGDIYIIKTDKLGFSDPPLSLMNNFETIPDNFKLFQNYPNPFNPVTIISYSIRKNSFVRIVIFDIKGKEIKRLINEFKLEGIHKIQFNAYDLPSGVYFYRMLIDNRIIDFKKMILIR